MLPALIKDLYYRCFSLGSFGQIVDCQFFLKFSKNEPLLVSRHGGQIWQAFGYHGVRITGENRGVKPGGA